jgi:hypothetical protein
MRLVSTLLLAALAGCSIHAQPLTELTLTRPPLAEGLHTDKRILVMPFRDMRGGEYLRIAPSSNVPVVNWFHSGELVFYPEHVGMLRTHVPRGDAVTVGSIGSAMPSLLVDTLRKMEIAPWAVAGGDDPNIVAPDFDYVVTGRILKTRFRQDQSAILQLGLGLFGVPYRFATYDLEYEISLFDNRDPSRAVFTHVYSTTEHVAQGLYYNHDFAYPMFVRGLERTLPEVAQDLARLLAGRT